MKNSSTSATVITNYFKWRGLDDEGKIFKSLGGCYPAKWNPYCRPGGHYLDYLPSIKYHHRLNLDVQLPLMAPNTTLITTIRNPLSFLHSSYNYFYQKFSRLDYGGPGCNVECSGEPYYGWLGNRTEVPVTKFLDILDDAYEPNDKYSFRARNFQCYEMGLDEKADADEDAMRDNIARLLNQFDGIIITERFLESLVLLAAVLHIPVEYLYAVSENISAKYEKPSLSKEQMATFQKYFRMDIMLYELAEKKMERQIESFGRERMNRELEKLHQLQALCEGDKSICSRKRHVRLSSDPRQAQILAASNHVPHEARRNTVPMERDKEWGRWL